MTLSTGLKSLLKPALFLAVSLCCYSQLSAQLPPDFYNETIGTSWGKLVGITFDALGQGYAWSRSGEVWVLDTNDHQLPEPLLDISEEVADWWDLGMLGFALDPDFLQNGYFYLFYVVDRHHLFLFGTPEYDPETTVLNQATIGRITRYQADASTRFTTTIPGSRKVLLGETADSGFPILYKTHGTGSLVFGEDGTLLASCGDSGFPEYHEAASDPNTYFQQALDEGIIRPAENVGPFRAQLVNGLNGKIIRIDPATGDGIPGNPFYDAAAPRSPRSRVWALGLRNPYRFTLVPNTGSHFPADADPGTLLVGDVGLNSWEELNMVTKGGQNFGWPLYEGMALDSVFWGFNMLNQDAPNPLGCVVPYFRFRDLMAPASLLPANDLLRNPCDATTSIPLDIETFVHRRPAIAYLNHDDAVPEPEAYVGRFDTDGNARVYSIEAPESGVSGERFEGISSIAGVVYQGSSFPEEYRGRYFHVDYSGWIKLFDFDTNDQLTAVETFYTEAKDIVNLVENPKNGCLYYIDFKGQKMHRICYGGKPAPVVTATADPPFGPSPLAVHFDAGASFSPAGSPLEFQWDFGDGSSATGPAPVHTFSTTGGQPTSFEVQLTVADTFGKAKQQSLLVSLNNTPPEVQITGIEDGGFYGLQEVYLTLKGEAQDAEHSQESLDWHWRIFLEHDTHEHLYLDVKKRTALVQIASVGCEGDHYAYRFELTVTDPAGLSTTEVAKIFPWCGEPFFQILDFYGKGRVGQIDLWWSLDPDATSAIEIERSSDGVFFEKIGRTAGGLSAGKAYTFTDPEPLQGDNFYQLRFRNADGAFGFSDILRIAFPPEPELTVFPNPATSEALTLRLRRSESAKVRLQVFNLLGTPVGAAEWDAVPKTPFEVTYFMPSSVADGVYFLLMEDGNFRYVERVFFKK